MIKSLEARLAELTGDGKSDEQRAEELKKITLSWDAARLKLEEIAAKLSEFKDNPVDTVARWRSSFRRRKRRPTRLAIDEKTRRGKASGPQCPGHIFIAGCGGGEGGGSAG